MNFTGMTPQEAAGALRGERRDSEMLIYCHRCQDSVIYKRLDDGRIEFFHSCSGGFVTWLNQLVMICHERSKAAGWWDGVDPNDKTVYGAKIALIHTEASESLEGDRKDLMDDHLPHRKMAEVELADLIIRACDLAGAKGFDLGGAVAEKLEYNRTRADHTREARAAAGGKKI